MPGTIPNGCWPDDPLDGYTKIEVPPESSMRAYWDAAILDPELQPSHKILTTTKPFTIRFRVVLLGELWCCMCGNWCFNVGCTPIGDGKSFNIADLIGRDPFWLKGWKGCDMTCVERCVTVPAGTIPTDYCGILYECGAWFELHCCDKGPVAVVGFKPLGERFFFNEDPEGCPKPKPVPPAPAP